MFTKTITNFKQGMNPNLYGDGIVRIEHFQSTTEQAKPYRALVATDMTHGDAGTLKSVTKFASVNDVIYTVGQLNQTAARPTFAKWDGTNKYWNNFQDFNKDSVYAELIFAYAGNLYGLWRDGSGAPTGYLWKMTPAGSLTAQHQTIAWTNYCDSFYRKANNLQYLGIDNSIYSFNGTTLTKVFEHPLTTFIWTNISENGINIQLTGYDSASLEATSYMWDGDSSVNDVSQKFSLGYDRPCHQATLGGVTFFVLSDRTSANIPDAGTQQAKKLIIKYTLNDGLSKEVNTFDFTQCDLFGSASNGSVKSSGSFVEDDKLYFGGKVKFRGDTDYSYVLFRLDAKGQLTIAQNLDQTTIDLPCGIHKERDGLWISAGGITTKPSYHTTTTEVTASYPAFFETVKYSAQNFTEDIDVLGYTVTFEPLASGASVVVKTRADAETAWTTLATFAVDDSVQGSMTGIGTNTVAERQFRVESIGGAIITGWSVTFNTIPNTVYHYATK
jgi:hypothetical protein